MRYFTPLATLALAVTFAACSKDAVEEVVTEAPGNVHITLSAPFNAPAARAPQSAGYTADVDKTRELIESYYVVFTQGDGSAEHVVKVVNDADVRVDDTGKKSSNPADNIYGVEEKRLDLELRPGTYKVYAFANIPESELTSLSYKASDLHALAYKIPDAIMTGSKSFQDKSFVPCEDVEMVPMSNTILEDGGGNAVPQTITVTERTSQKFDIEVVRMLAKVEFQFRNPTTTDLKINRIKMSDLTVNNSTVTPKRDGATMLMNYNDLYTGHNSGTNSFLNAPINRPAGFNTATLDANYKLPSSDPNYIDEPQALDAHTNQSVSFYVLESQAKDYSSPDPLDGTFVDNAFNLDFDITPSAAGTYTDNIRYAITKPDNFTTIHRNDWIVIPVTIGEWVMSLTAFSYPPIGGYPSARVSADKSGNFHVAFATPGDISFYPLIHKYYSTTDNFYLNDPDRIVKYAGESLDPSNPKDEPFMGLTTGAPYISLTVDPAWDAPTSILSSEPAIDPFTGSIETILNSKTGKTTLTLAVRFYKTLPTGGETAEQLKAMQETLISKIVIERI